MEDAPGRCYYPGAGGRSFLLNIVIINEISIMEMIVPHLLNIFEQTKNNNSMNREPWTVSHMSNDKFQKIDSQFAHKTTISKQKSLLLDKHCRMEYEVFIIIIIMGYILYGFMVYLYVSQRHFNIGNEKREDERKHSTNVQNYTIRSNRCDMCVGGS